METKRKLVLVGCIFFQGAASASAASRTPVAFEKVRPAFAPPLSRLLQAWPSAVDGGVPPEAAGASASAAAGVEGLRAGLPFMSRVGPDVGAEIAQLGRAKAALKNELERLKAWDGRLPKNEEKAVAAHEADSLLSAQSKDSASHYYVRRTEGLLNFVTLELRAREAAVLYARLKPALPASVRDDVGFRVLRRVMRPNGKDVTAAQLAGLVEFYELKRREGDLHRKRDGLARPAELAETGVLGLKQRLDVLEGVRRDEYYRKIYQMTPEQADREISGIVKKLASARLKHARALKKSATGVAAIDARIKALDAAGRAQFEKVGSGLFKDYNGMHWAVVSPDEVRGCCGKGCWDCPFGQGMTRNNDEDFFEGRAPLKPAPPPSPYDGYADALKGPEPSALAFYKTRAELKALLPYVGD